MTGWSPGSPDTREQRPLPFRPAAQHTHTGPRASTHPHTHTQVHAHTCTHTRTWAAKAPGATVIESSQCFSLHRGVLCHQNERHRKVSGPSGVPHGCRAHCTPGYPPRMVCGSEKGKDQQELVGAPEEAPASQADAGPTPTAPQSHAGRPWDRTWHPLPPANLCQQPNSKHSMLVLRGNTWCFLHKNDLGVLQKVVARQDHPLPSKDGATGCTLLLHEGKLLGRALGCRGGARSEPVRPLLGGPVHPNPPSPSWAAGPPMTHCQREGSTPLTGPSGDACAYTCEYVCVTPWE